MTAVSKQKKTGISFLCAASPALLALVSWLLVGNVQSRYALLAKPPLALPALLLPLVWFLPPLLMGAAFFLFVSAAPKRGDKTAGSTFFALHMGAWFAWSLVFALAGALWVSFVLLLAVDILALCCTEALWKIRRLAGVLMLPVVLWLAYATYLNISLAVLNTPWWL